MFHKPITKIVKEDILRIIEDKVQEGYGIEFKEYLPSKKGNDPWYEGKNHIGDYARNQILEEIIAFANAYGGVVCIGISESDSKPAIAKGINAIPNCADLAERLKLQCRDCIEPQIALIETGGVVTNDDGSGVVIINVPQSRLAPHRHMVSRECYVRRADRTEKMTMREIQDLTLHTERGMAKIDTLLKDRRSRFEEKLSAFRKPLQRIYGLRITALPTSDVHIDNIHNRNDVKSSFLTFKGTFDGRSYIPFMSHLNNGPWKPILRGTFSELANEEIYFSMELSANGAIDLCLLIIEKENRHIIYPDWFMGMLCNSLYFLHRARNASDAHSVEYALEIQLNNIGGVLKVDGYGSHNFTRSYGSISESNVIFPRYSVLSMDTFQDLSSIIETDFWGHAGVPTQDNTIHINFDELIT